MGYPEKSYYDTLGVPRNATDVQIKAAYREQIKFFHPDVFRGNPEVAKEKSLELNEAYGVLIDPVKRDKYDFWLNMRDAQRKEAREQEARQQEYERDKEKAQEQEQESGEDTEHGGKQSSQDDASDSIDEDDSHDQSVQKANRNHLIQKILAGCLALSVAAGVCGYAMVQMKLTDTAAQLEESERENEEISKNTVIIQELRDFYKRSEECCDYLADVFNNIYATPAIYTAFGGSKQLLKSTREQLESDLSLVEDCFAECKELDALTSEDSELLDEVRRLCEDAVDCLDALEAYGISSDIANEASNSTFDAISAEYTAREYYWDLTNPEQ